MLWEEKEKEEEEEEEENLSKPEQAPAPHLLYCHFVILVHQRRSRRLLLQHPEEFDKMAVEKKLLKVSDSCCLLPQYLLQSCCLIVVSHKRAIYG
jgi:hypothetical protein